MDYKADGDKTHKTLMWSAVLIGFSHMFCCVLPGAFSLLALLSGFGLIVTLPGWLSGLHALTHEWEIYIIVLSGVIVAFGWASSYYSQKNDCHQHGCDHGSCQPRKRAASKILIAATVLFAVNTVVYFGFHALERAETNIEIHDHNH